MPSWWGNPSSKEAKIRTNRGSFIDAMHRKFKSGSEGKNSSKFGGSERYHNDTLSEKGLVESRSVLPSLEVSCCQSFAEQAHAQPLPLPDLHLESAGHADSGIIAPRLELHGPLPIPPLPRNGYDPSKPFASDAWGDLATASVSSNSSMDTDGQPDSRHLSPRATDYESGITSINSPSSKRLRDQSPVVTRRILKDQLEPVSLPARNHIHLTSEKRGALSAHMTKLQIPRSAGCFSAPHSSFSSPSRSPSRACGRKKVVKSGLCEQRQYSDIHLSGCRHCSSPGSGQNSRHNSVVGDVSLFWPQSRCCPECSPIPSPGMTSPSAGPRVQSGNVTPLHSRAGGLARESSVDRPDDGKPQGHKLPLPPITISSSSPLSPPYSTVTTPSLPRNPGRAESSTSPVSLWKKGRLIGSGTFGHVYLGFNSESGEMCAMKEVTLLSDDVKSKESEQQLGQEITLLSRLRHPNIVRYFGSEMVDDKLYIYLEYVSGGSIHKLLREYGKLGESAIRSYTQQILSGLAYLHAKNTVHRDIKGANILVDPSGRIKLADFGMAKHITGQSCPLSFKGSPYWMAPEVITNCNGCHLAVDIWSLGCTVIEMATAKPPWSEYEGVSALFKIGNSKELPTIPDHLSEEGKDFVKQCLQRNPLDRPTSFELLEHPFVRNGAPLERPVLSPKLQEPLRLVTDAAKYMGAGAIERLSCLYSDRVAVQLSKDSKIGSGSRNPCMPKHVSCPVSPIGSPLLQPKSSQPAHRRSPPILSRQTASGSCTPCTDGSNGFRKHPFDPPPTTSHHGVGIRRPQKDLFASRSRSPLYSKLSLETLRNIPEICRANREELSSQAQSNSPGSRNVQLPYRDPREFYDQCPVLADHVSQKLLMDHLKLNLSPDLFMLGRANMI